MTVESIDRKIDITAEWRAASGFEDCDDTADALMVRDDGDDERVPFHVMFGARISFRLGGHVEIDRSEAMEVFGAAMIADFERRADEPLPVTE